MPPPEKGNPSSSFSSRTQILLRRQYESEDDPLHSSSEVEEEEEKVKTGNENNRKKKAPITISLKKVCKVCKETGHLAGFQGSNYIDCPRMPCYLCPKNKTGSALLQLGECYMAWITLDRERSSTSCR